MIPQTLLLTLLFNIAYRYFDQDLFNRIQTLVIELMDETIPGDQKREKVRAAIKVEFTDISTIVIDTIIQIVLLKNTNK